MRKALRVPGKGIALLLSVMIMLTIVVITTALLCMASIRTKSMGQNTADLEALWLAEAGLQEAVWQLKTPVWRGGRGEDWTTSGMTGDLGDGNATYTVSVERWDWALGEHNSTAAASSEENGHEADKVIDGDDGTYWETENKPQMIRPEEVIISFPYPLTINKARYLAPDYRRRPRVYAWQVSEDGEDYTTVYSGLAGTMDETDEFDAVDNVNHLRFRVFQIGGGSSRDGLRVSTIEAIGSRIVSTGAVGVIERAVEQTVAVDDSDRAAYDEIDWNEVVPVR